LNLLGKLVSLESEDESRGVIGASFPVAKSFEAGSGNRFFFAGFDSFGEVDGVFEGLEVFLGIV
jgi:hypothetical protein